MLEKITIRSGTRQDFPVVQDIERDGAAIYSEIGYDFCCTGPVRSYVELERGPGSGALIIAETNEKPVGFALVWAIDEKAHLAELSVRKRFQRQGIGFQLLAFVENWAIANGFREITLTTFSEVPWNGPAYMRHGYELLEITPDCRQLEEIRNEEARAGYAQKPRIAMFKSLKAT